MIAREVARTTGPENSTRPERDEVEQQHNFNFFHLAATSPIAADAKDLRSVLVGANNRLTQIAAKYVELQREYDLLRVERDMLLAEKDVYHDRINKAAIRAGYEHVVAEELRKMLIEHERCMQAFQSYLTSAEYNAIVYTNHSPRDQARAEAMVQQRLDGRLKSIGLAGGVH